jgi:hypothetical protein
MDLPARCGTASTLSDSSDDLERYLEVFNREVLQLCS